MFPAKLLNLARLADWFRSAFSRALVSSPVDGPTPNKVNRRCCSAHAHESQPSAEACVEPRGFLEQEHIRGHEGTRSAKVDDGGNGNGTLVSTTRVDRNPNDGNRHGDVGTARDEEHACISSSRGRRVDDLDDKPTSQNGLWIHKSVKRTRIMWYLRRGWRKGNMGGTMNLTYAANEIETEAMVHAFGHETEDDGNHSASEVYGYAVNLCRCCSITQSFENSRLEVGERVCVFGDTEVHSDTG